MRCVLLLSLLAVVNTALANDPDVIELNPFPRGGDFELQHVDGPFRLASLRGKAVVVYFGYTSCPDVCPTSLVTVQQALAELPASVRQQIRVVFVGIDPERDTPPHIDAYSRYFGEEFIGVTGNADALLEVADRYGAQYHRVELPGSAMEYAMEHSSALAMVGTQGRLRALFRHTIEPRKLAGALNWLVHEKH